MAKYSALQKFVDLAEHNRKYAPNTATGYRVALGVFETVLNVKEKESLQTFSENLERIYQEVFRKNKSKTTSTLEIYKRRVKKVIKDYDAYGNDPSKLNAWNPARRQRPSFGKNRKDREEIAKQDNETSSSQRNMESTIRFELPLAGNRKAIILTPINMTKQEADKIIAYIGYLKSVSERGSSS